MYDFISLPDRRNDEKDLTAQQAFKAWRMHEALFGPCQCIISIQGVEVDPEEEFAPRERRSPIAAQAHGCPTTAKRSKKKPIA